MKAIGYNIAGQTNVLLEINVNIPTPKLRDILVSVKAVSVNPIDTKIRKTMTPTEGETKILGYDAAGIIEAIGSDVSLFKVGDEVYYSGITTRQGSNAEYQLVDERIVGYKPRSLSFTQAAALPLTALTAWELLFDRLRVPYGIKTVEGTLLVVNGAGGVGSILVQLGRRLTGLLVIASASRPETVAWVRKLGAHHTVNHHKKLAEEVRALGVAQVEYVAGLLGTADQMLAIAEIIAPQGNLALIDGSVLDIGLLKPKSVTVSWEMVFTRPLFQTPDLVKQHSILNEVGALVDAGLLVSTMTEEMGPMSAENLRAAHQKVESGHTIGKIVLSGFT